LQLFFYFFMKQDNSMSSSSENPTIKALFEDGNEFCAEAFRDKVNAIHEHFDRDKDGYLNFHELADLQYRTSGNELDAEQYAMVCKALGLPPNKGMALQALRLTYAADGTDLEDDYYKVFPERKKEQKKQEDDGEEQVYEVGADGFDISG
jgi:hypothetical protein